MSNVSWVRSGGPLAPFADGYGAELARLGFTHHSVVTHVVLMGQLSRWMSDAGIVAGDLTEDRVQGFCDARRAGGQNRVPTARTLVPLFGYLRSCGIVPPPPGVVPAIRARTASLGDDPPDQRTGWSRSSSASTNSAAARPVRDVRAVSVTAYQGGPVTWIIVIAAALVLLHQAGGFRVGHRL